MRLQARQYLFYHFIRHFVLVIKRVYNKSSLLDQKNNHRCKYTKKVG